MADRTYHPGAPRQPEQPEDPQFLTVSEVAAMVRVSKMTIYRLIHDGRLPAARVGRSFRVARADVDVFLEKAFRDIDDLT